MNKETNRSLQDVHDICSEIEELTKDVSLDAFECDRLLYLSIERLFEIAGEAFTRALRFNPDLLELLPAGRQLIGMRNRIAHDYDNIRLDILWETARHDIPILRNETRALLGEDESGFNS